MNITFMLGNGFDMNMGLKTSYSDFLQYYLAIPRQEDVHEHFRRFVNAEMPNWTDVEVAIGQSTRYFFGDTAGDDFLAWYDDLYDCLAAYLAGQEETVTGHDPAVLRQGMVHALTHWQDGFRASRAAAIAERFAACPGEFRYNFLTFNYTRTIDACIEASQGADLGSRVTPEGECANRIGRIVHVHGYTNKDMILGVNDESQIANPLLLMDRVSFERDRIVKQKANRLFEEGTDELAHSVLADSDLVYIYGMSLGKTDKLWWQRLGALLARKPHVQVIIFAYGAPVDDLHYHRFLRFEREQQLKILSNCGNVPEDAMSRIHVTAYNVFGQLKDIARESGAAAE